MDPGQQKILTRSVDHFNSSDAGDGIFYIYKGLIQLCQSDAMQCLSFGSDYNFHQFVTKPLPEPVWSYHELNPTKLNLKKKNFPESAFENVHFAQTSMFFCFFSFCRWLDKLGLSAKMGIGVVMRQSFYGQNYSLIENDFFPNPVS